MPRGPVLLLPLLLSALACESETMVGSACSRGICETGLALEGLRCLVGELHVTLAAQPVTADSIPLALCPPERLPRTDNGLVECTMIFTLPAGVPECTPYLGTRPIGEDVDSGAIRCMVNQLAVFDGALADASGGGWYLDDFGDGATRCEGGGGAIVLNGGQPAPPGVVIDLHCTTAVAVDGPTTDAGAPATVTTDLCARATRGSATLGQACEPALVPPGGFDPAMTHIDVGTPECASSACLIFGVDGNPRSDCDPNGDRCSPADAGARPYCSCRCGLGATVESDACRCADGFSCARVMESGPQGIGGGYCVRDGVDGGVP